jgi:aspartyl-tRNA(Asn)/glutamyl-tRNA(Gln) amidotransferase subunit A
MEYSDYTIRELKSGLEDEAFGAEEVVESFLGAVQTGETYNAFVSVREADELAERAREIDERRAADEPVGSLAGIPIAVKDNICTEVLPTTAGSGMLKGFRPPYAATVVERLREAGALVFGKTNLDAFAMGSSNENSHFGPVENPRDPDCIPGGSSGGSAAAVAADLVPGALGSDTGGSIRQPAAHCGVVGLKPTYGRVSRRGLVAFASSLDQIGPIAETIDDAALLLETIAGHDPADATSVDETVPTASRVGETPPGELTVGVPEEYFGGATALDESVESSVRSAIDALAEAGADVVEISLPHTEYAVAAYYLIATAEASSNLARYDGIRYGHRADAGDLDEMYAASRAEGFGDEVKRRIILGTYVLSEGYKDDYYERAQKVRTLVRRDFEEAFEIVDVVAAPTTPSTAFEIGERVDDPLQMYLADVFTTSCNLAGIPGLSLPCGASSEGLPVGIQLMAPALDEATLLDAGAALEEAVDVALA